jgi:hypothetical protein
MDRIKPAATTFQVGRGQEPQKVESNRSDLEIVEGEQDFMRLPILAGGERTAHASGQSRDGAHSSARQSVDGSAYPGGRIRYLGRQAGLYPGKTSRANLEGKTRETRMRLCFFHN